MSESKTKAKNILILGAKSRVIAESTVAKQMQYKRIKNGDNVIIQSSEDYKTQYGTVKVESEDKALESFLKKHPDGLVVRNGVPMLCSEILKHRERKPQKSAKEQRASKK